MSLRRSVAPPIRAIHPALFLVGFAVVALQSVLSFGLAALRAVIPDVYEPIVALAGPFVVFALTLPLAVGIYRPVRDRTDGTSETLRSAGRAVRNLFLRLLAANIAAFAVAAVGAMAATAVTFALVTAGQFARYAAANPGQPALALTVWTFPLLFVTFFAAGVLVTRFADVFVAFGDDAPRTAWRSSAAFARRNPLSFVGYALATLVFLGTAQVLQFALEQVDDVVSLLVAAAVIVLVGTVGFVLAAALHVTYFDSAVLSTVRDAPPASPQWSRVAGVAVVLLAAVAGAGCVRAVDAGVGQAEMQALPDDAQAAYPVAANNTRHANHRRHVLTNNVSDPGSSFRTVSRTAVDYDDRQLSVFLYGEDPAQRVGGFMGEGTIAIPGDGGSWRNSFAPLTSARNGWTVVAMPGFASSDPTGAATVPNLGANWTVAASNASTVVYRVDRADEIREATPESYYGMYDDLGDDSYFAVVVDRERGVVDSAHMRLHSLETGHVREYEMRYSDVGTADVERPAEIGQRSPIEWFWDVLYY